MDDPRIVSEQYIAPRGSDAAVALAGRLIATYAIVGASLGVSTLVFLWAVGFFDKGSANPSEDIGSIVAGGIAVVVVLIFGLLMGLVLAVFAAAHISGRTTSRGEAAAVGFATAAIGYVVMSALLGMFVIGGIAVFKGSKETQTAPQETVDPQCVQVFGANSPVCAPRETQPTSGSDTSLTVQDIGRIALTGLPGVVIASAAAPLLYDRRRLPA